MGTEELPGLPGGIRPRQASRWRAESGSSGLAEHSGSGKCHSPEGDLKQRGERPRSEMLGRKPPLERSLQHTAPLGPPWRGSPQSAPAHCSPELGLRVLRCEASASGCRERPRAALGPPLPPCHWLPALPVCPPAGSRWPRAGAGAAHCGRWRRAGRYAARERDVGGRFLVSLLHGPSPGGGGWKERAGHSWWREDAFWQVWGLGASRPSVPPGR